jgi:hypothetical protein
MTARRRAAPSKRRVALRAKTRGRDADDDDDDGTTAAADGADADADGTAVTRARALEARLAESESLRDGMRDALETLKEKYETLAMAMAGAVEARRAGFTSAEMKREVGLAKASASEERARRMRAEAALEVAERRAREATAERNEALAAASAHLASGGTMGAATVERVAALEEALASAARETKSLKQCCDRQKRELAKARARIKLLKNSHPPAGDAATPSSPPSRGDAARAKRRARDADATADATDRPTTSPTTAAESREPPFPTIVANWNAPLPPVLPPLGGAPALASSTAGKRASASSALKPPRARSLALARRNARHS